jgi:hypothetical protein
MAHRTRPFHGRGIDRLTPALTPSEDRWRVDVESVNGGFGLAPCPKRDIVVRGTVRLLDGARDLRPK